MKTIPWIALLLLGYVAPLIAAETWPSAIKPVMTVVDLNVGESATATLSDGTSANVKLVDLREIRDDLRQAVRQSRVTIEINGEKTTLVSANYRLPEVAGGVQVDCAVTQGCTAGTGDNPWALKKDARLRLWPAGSPWIRPGTFRYPANQRWFASEHANGQRAGVCAITARCRARRRSIITAVWTSAAREGWSTASSATDAVVVSAGQARLLGDRPISRSCVKPRVRCRLSPRRPRLVLPLQPSDSIDPAMKLGARVKMGQKVGVLGKEGASGGWSHLHFDIIGAAAQRRVRHRRGLRLPLAGVPRRAPDAASGRRPAAPRRLGRASLSCSTASRSWSGQGPDTLRTTEWTLSDGTTAEGPTVTRVYDEAGRVQRDPQGDRCRRPRGLRFRRRADVRPQAHPKLLPPGDSRRVLAHVRRKAGRRGDVQGPQLRRSPRRKVTSVGTSATARRRWRSNPTECRSACQRRLRSHHASLRQTRRLPRLRRPEELPRRNRYGTAMLPHRVERRASSVTNW